VIPTQARGLFTPDALRICARTVMDNTDPDIVFDNDGVSNWWHDFRALKASQPDGAERDRLLQAAIEAIKAVGRREPYDCVLGLSGGVDSSYLAYLAKQWGLRPLVLHFDNGWNDELAVANIEVIVKNLGFRLQTFVMNWPEFRDLQRAYFKASVIDLDIPSDHMIFGALWKVAARHGIKWILSGTNVATEWVLPKAWYYSKFDFENVKTIHKAFGDVPMRHLPKFGVWQRLYYERVKSIRLVSLLDLIPYTKAGAKKLLSEKFGWRDYGGKHYESVFTRFYQGYILPRKFGIDKRKAHLSNLILNGEMTRAQALAELAKPPDGPDRQRSDKRYVAKKLGWSDEEFDAILSLPPRRHEEFGTDAVQARLADRTIQLLQPFAKVGRAVLRV
jgi:N-acetyl sugar amidotransferase